MGHGSRKSQWKLSRWLFIWLDAEKAKIFLYGSIVDYKKSGKMIQWAVGLSGVITWCSFFHFEGIEKDSFGGLLP